MHRWSIRRDLKPDASLLQTCSPYHPLNIRSFSRQQVAVIMRILLTDRSHLSVIQPFGQLLHLAVDRHLILIKMYIMVTVHLERVREYRAREMLSVQVEVGVISHVYRRVPEFVGVRMLSLVGEGQAVLGEGEGRCEEDIAWVTLLKVWREVA